MSKIIIILLTAPFILGFFAHGSAESFNLSQNTPVAPTPPAKKNSAPEVRSFISDKIEVYIPCPPGTRSFSGNCTDDMTVKISTEVFDAENDTVNYKYTVTGGRIVGQGANVIWDLNGVRPGRYEITVAANDGFGFRGTTKTIQITVAECVECGCGVCECPEMSVTVSPKEHKPGELIVFSVNVSGGSQDEVIYKWSIKGGRIIEGHGTPVIEVFPLTPDSKVTVTINLEGICESCPLVSATETVLPAPKNPDNLIY